MHHKTILSLQRSTLVVNQNKVCLSTFYKNSLDSVEKQKPKSVFITDSIITLHSKIGNKGFLPCDIKKYNLHSGDEEIITFGTKKTQ